MKHYEEMAARVLQRRDEYMAAKKRARQRYIAVAVSGCTIVALAVGIWRNGRTVENSAVTEEGPMQSTSIYMYQASDTTVDHIGVEVTGPHDPAMEDPVDAGESAPEIVSLEETKQKTESCLESDQNVQIDVGEPNWEDVPVQNDEPEVAVDWSPRCYGGCYIDPQGRLHAQFTEDTPENRALVAEFLEKSEDDLIFETVAYSYEYLDAVMAKITAGMVDHTLRFVYTAGIYEMENCVKVSVAQDTTQEQLDQLKRIAPKGGLVIEAGEPIVVECE